MPKEFLDYDLSGQSGYPSSPDLYFECTRCGDEIPTAPPDNAYCQCRNVIVDVEAGRVSIKSPSEVKLLRKHDSTYSPLR